MPLDVQRIRSQRPQNELHYFRSIGSTMTEAGRLAGAGAPHGTVVIADEQTAGVGRLGRAWQSHADAGIYCSIVLRLPLTADALPIATLMLGLAAAEAIQRATGLACDLRWPNDVLVRGRKIAGILAHLVGDCIISGIGINVNQTEFPDDLRTPATSVRMESGRPGLREEIVIALLESLDHCCSLLISDGPSAILRAFTAASSYVANRRVLLDDSGKRGLTCGLDENGFLLIRLDSGQIDRVVAGGVRPDPAP